MNVRLLRPPRERLTTLIFAGSKKPGKGTPQPVALGPPLAAVESPAIQIVGNAGLRATSTTGFAGSAGGASVVSFAGADEGAFDESIAAAGAAGAGFAVCAGQM